MNRHSRVLPFPQGKGKEKDKSSSQNSNGVKSHLSSSTIASSSRGVAKSGIKGVKGLVSSLSVATKTAHISKEKHGAQSVAPSISAAVAAASVVPSRTQNKTESALESKPAALESQNARLVSHIPEHGSNDAKTAIQSFNCDSSKEGAPITDVKSLELVQTYGGSTVNDANSSASPTLNVEKGSPEKGGPEGGCLKAECTGSAVEEVTEVACSCPSDKENGGCTAFCKDVQKESSPSFITVVGKHKVHESVRETFKLRLLCPDDVPEVKALCGDWFPVEYPDSWYQDITSDKRFHSLAAVINNKIVGLLVSEVKARARLHREDSTILSSAFPSITQVAYILSLGVVSTFRRLGIATALLTNLLNYLNTHDKLNVKAVYLHVLASNTNAISFYEKHNFRRHEYLPYYYAIRGKGKDGLSYVLYINGGQPPWTLLDYMKLVGAYISRMQPSSLPSAMANRTRNFLASRRSWLPSLPSFPSMPTVSLPSMNMNILQRFRGQQQGQGSSQDPEVGLSPEEVAALEGEDPDDLGPGRNRSWLPSVKYYNLLQRFGGQCYDSGEPSEFEDVESGPPRL